MDQRTNNNRINEQGFTLLETIVAIAILALAITGPLELAARSIGMANVSKNQITAFYLAQEGMEYVKNIRDKNFLTPGSGWLDGLDSCRSASGCYVDIPNNTVNACTGDCPVLKFDSSGSFYNYIAGSDTVFRRIIKITSPIGINTDEAKVEVTLSWNERFRPKTFTIEDNIFNWK